MGIRSIAVYPSAIMQFVRLDESMPINMRFLTSKWNPAYERMELLIESPEWSDNHHEGNPVEVVKIYRERR